MVIDCCVPFDWLCVELTKCFAILPNIRGESGTEWSGVWSGVRSGVRSGAECRAQFRAERGVRSRVRCGERCGERCGVESGVRSAERSVERSAERSAGRCKFVADVFFSVYAAGSEACQAWVAIEKYLLTNGAVKYQGTAPKNGRSRKILASLKKMGSLGGGGGGKKGSKKQNDMSDDEE